VALAVLAPINSPGCDGGTGGGAGDEAGPAASHETGGEPETLSPWRDCTQMCLDHASISEVCTTNFHMSVSETVRIAHPD
jgi:hypothetical protein